MNSEWKALVLRYVSLGSSLLIAQKNNDEQKIVELEREMAEIKAALSMSHEAIVNEGASIVMKAE